MKKCPHGDNVDGVKLNGCPSATRRMEQMHNQISGHRPYSSIPGPKRLNEVLYRTDCHKYISLLHDQYGDIIRLTVDETDFVFVRNPETCKKLLTSEDLFEKTFADADKNSTNYIQYFKNLVQPLFSSAEIFGSGDNSGRRQALAKCFGSADTLLPKFDKICKNILEEQWPKSASTDMVGKIHLLVFELVAVIMCGDEVDNLKVEMAELFEAANLCLSHFVKRYTKPMFVEKIQPDDEKYMKIVENAGMKVTETFVSRAKRNMISNATKETAFLGVMLKAGLTLTEINTTMLNALFAASEAPIHVLGAVLIELSKQKTIQDKLYKEIHDKMIVKKKILEDEEEENCDDFFEDYIIYDKNMLDSIIMEGLRLHSPVTLVQRRVKFHKGVVLDGYMVPANTNVCICI